MQLTPGVRLGPYEIVALLGAGGMGEVYRAHDGRLHRDVALKVLPEALARDSDRLARSRREAQVLAALNHPNIAGIYGIEEAAPTGAQTGIHALVLEVVEGLTLADRIAQGPLPLDEALPIAKQVAEAFEAAHAAGVIHRDLKPANIKVRPDGTVKVLDFGLAKLGDPAGSGAGSTAASLANSPTITSPAMTELGVILGTAAYMAPEQAKGRPVDKRADIWAFGCVLYEMLTGRRAFEGDDVSDTLASILRAEPHWDALPESTPPPLKRLLRRCLSKDLNGRLPDIGSARLEIADALALPDPADGTTATSTSVPVVRRRSRWRDFALGAVVAAGVAIPLAVADFGNTAPVPATVRFAIDVPGSALSVARIGVAISPDGRFVAYRAGMPPDGPLSVWVRALDTFEARQIEGTEGASFHLIWSPDSRALAFFAGGQLKRIDIAVGAVRTISELDFAGFGGSWSPDGTILIGSAHGVRRVPSSGGSPTPVTSIDATKQEEAHIQPQWLPDGRRFLFTAAPSGTVYLGSLDEDRSPMQIMTGGSQARFDRSGRLLFVRDGTLIAQPFDDARGVLAGDPVPIAERVRTTNGGGMADFSLSDTGVLVYQASQAEETFAAVWADRQGRELGPATSIDGVLFPRLSPDGRRLALTRDADVWVQDLDGRPPIRLTFDGRKNQYYSPLWAPDGRRLTYERTSPPRGLLSIAADGRESTPTPASPEGHFHPHGWSADDRDLLIVAFTAAGATDIMALGPGEDSELRPVVATPANEGQTGAALSPDGRWLAYAATTTGRSEIWVRAYPGPSAPHRVSPNGGREPVWARHGRELFYVEGEKMMALAVEPGLDFRFRPPVMLFDGFALGSSQPPNYDVAPDGRFVLLKAKREERTEPRIHIVINWTADLDGRVPTP